MRDVMRLLSFVILLFPGVGSIKAQSRSNITITGYVFNDVNKNGMKDANETGVSHVAVSDQVNVVTTNEDGLYQIKYSSNYGILFVSVPSGYQSTTAFWRRVDSTNAQLQINFALTKIPSVTSFTFIQASDTHVSEASLNRMQKFRSIADSVKPNFILITGDLVRDALRVSEREATGLYELFLKEINKITPPIWCAAGNHEIFGIERHLSLVSQQHPLYGRKMYRHYLGPDYYSFNYGGIHFIALNSLEFEDLWYYGRIDSVQLEWLKKDLATISSSTPIVTFQHVPFYSGGFTLLGFEEDGPGRSLVREHGVLQYRHIVSNAEDVLAIFHGHNYPLALAGHYHFQQRFSLEGFPTRFEQTGAVVGPSDGNVFKLPSGVTVYHVKDGKIDEGKFVVLDK